MYLCLALSKHWTNLGYCPCCHFSVISFPMTARIIEAISQCDIEQVPYPLGPSVSVLGRLDEMLLKEPLPLMFSVGGNRQLRSKWPSKCPKEPWNPPKTQRWRAGLAAVTQAWKPCLLAPVPLTLAVSKAGPQSNCR